MFFLIVLNQGKLISTSEEDEYGDLSDNDDDDDDGDDDAETESGLYSEEDEQPNGSIKEWRNEKSEDNIWQWYERRFWLLTIKLTVMMGLLSCIEISYALFKTRLQYLTSGYWRTVNLIECVIQFKTTQ